MSPRILLPPVLQRRLAVAIRHRLRPHCQSFSTTSQNPAPRLRPPTKLRPSTTPPPTALSALLSRLSLQPRVDLHDALIACITHPSYLASPSDTVTHSDTEGEVPTETNELLATLGNSLLGLFASEHLTSQYPYLPTEALKQAVTAYVGPVTCLSVARELGLAASGGGNLGIIGQGRGSASAGIAVRYHRTRVDEGGVPDGPETVPGARRFRKYEDAGSEGSERLRELRIADKRRARNREGFEDVVASSVRAFVGLIYQEAGIHTARQFVHAHFLTRHLDLVTLFNFKNPKHVLGSVVSRHLADSGVSPTSGAGRVEARLLASTGAQSQSPIYNIGLFLPSGLKLGEGHGSSKRMAEHRAAVNALHSFFLVRGGTHSGEIAPLPTSAHTDYPVDLEGVAWVEEERFEGKSWGGRESNVESGKKLGRGSR